MPHFSKEDMKHFISRDNTAITRGTDVNKSLQHDILFLTWNQQIYKIVLDIILELLTIIVPILGRVNFLIYSWYPRQQGSWDHHGAHLGPVGPRCAPCWPHEPCCQGYIGSLVADNGLKIRYSTNASSTNFGCIYKISMGTFFPPPTSKETAS